MVEAIAYLHKNGILYRDLKPENVLLDAEGHIRITDFGLSKQGLSQNQKTFSFCGTPEYLAPEIIQGKGHSFEVDWWSLGALMYEMLCGRPPHYNRDNKQQMIRDIVDKDIPWKSYLSPEAKSILKALLTKDPKKRIGGQKPSNHIDDAEDIRAHPFFADLDWSQIKTRTHKAVFIPNVKGTEDTSCIDQLFTREGLAETFVDPQKMISSLNQ